MTLRLNGVFRHILSESSLADIKRSAHPTSGVFVASGFRGTRRRGNSSSSEDQWRWLHQSKKARHTEQQISRIGIRSGADRPLRTSAASVLERRPMASAWVWLLVTSKALLSSHCIASRCQSPRRCLTKTSGNRICEHKVQYITLHDFKAKLNGPLTKKINSRKRDQEPFCNYLKNRAVLHPIKIWDVVLSLVGGTWHSTVGGRSMEGLMCDAEKVLAQKKKSAGSDWPR